uniref:Cytochrome b n=1 Tax=Parastrongyloides trichosuri TaxID=131310 RepID=A0A0N5A074_PARTI
MKLNDSLLLGEPRLLEVDNRCVVPCLFFGSYRLKFVWASGLTIFLLVMIEAFIGYVLVWAQMSFWASVVITSLLSVIPVYGPMLVV